MKISIIGPGDIDYHYIQLLGLDKNFFETEVTNIAKTIAASGYELILLPDKGICFEIAKKYRIFGGKKIIGTVPVDDTDFGIFHLKKQMEHLIDGEKLFDAFINTKDWYRQDVTHTTFGNITLMLGNSLGSLGELVYGFYLYKLFNGSKPEVKTIKTKIHMDIVAGEKTPFSAIIYLPFFKEKLNSEIEYYINKVGGKIYYVNNPSELGQILVKIKKDE